jgi:hypothetical protein
VFIVRRCHGDPTSHVQASFSDIGDMDAHERNVQPSARPQMEHPGAERGVSGGIYGKGHYELRAHSANGLGRGRDYTSQSIKRRRSVHV